MPQPAGFIPIGEGLRPDGTPGALFYVSAAYLDQLDQAGADDELEDSRFLEEVIAHPDAIFEGLPDEPAAFGYSVRLQHDPQEPGSTALPRYGVVFVASVRIAIGFVVYRWEWREEDAELPGHPDGWQTLFGSRTWNRT